MYLTYYTNIQNAQINNQKFIDFDQIFDTLGNLNILPETPTKALIKTEALNYRTIRVENLSESAMQNITRKINLFDQRFRILLSMYKDENMQAHYNTFKIPKASGGMRTINEPDETLKLLLRNIKDFCNNAGILAHTAAYAYVPGRTAKQAVERHIKTHADWYLHLDLHDFFGSCNKQFIYNTLNELPFFRYMPMDLMDLLLHAATLNDGLPQGTPLSPWLTNQIMIPYDHHIANACHRIGITYTRYADDMIFSAKKREKVLQATEIVKTILQNTPLRLNENKTRVSSIYGKNWQLGLMLNQQYNATIGNKKKENCRAALQNLCLHPEDWDAASAREFQGKLAYYTQIEPEYFEQLLKKYATKYNINIGQRLVHIIKTH